MRTMALLTISATLVGGCATTGPSMADDDVEVRETQPEDTERRAKALNHYLTSVVNLRRGLVEESIEDLRDASEYDEDSRLLITRLLAFYYREGDYENAATMAERALKQEPDSVILHIWLGRIYSQLNRTDDSTRMFERAIELDPNSTVAYEELVEIEEESNDLVGAVNIYESMIKRNPDSAFLYYRLGANLMEMNDAEGARSALERAIELDEKLAPARYVLGVIYMELDEWDLAEKTFVEFLSENPNHAASLENLASVLAQKGQYDRAYGILTGIIASEDVNVTHHIQRTYVYLRDPDVDPKFIASAPNDAPLLGSVLQMLVRRVKGEPNESIANSIDSVEGDLDYEVSALLGNLLSRYGSEEAGGFLADQIQGLLDDGHHSRVVMTVLGRAQLYAEEAKEAAETFNDVIERFGSEKWVHYYLATAYEELDNGEMAEAELRKTLEFDPNDPNVLNFLGYLLADEDRDLKEAEKMIKKALSYDPDNGFYLDSLGWVYFRQGKGEEAVDYIRRAIRAMSSDDAILRDHLGDAYLMVGDVDRALDEWERARRLDPDLEGVQEKIDKHRKKRRKSS